MHSHQLKWSSAYADANVSIRVTDHRPAIDESKEQEDELTATSLKMEGALTLQAAVHAALACGSTPDSTGTGASPLSYHHPLFIPSDLRTCEGRKTAFLFLFLFLFQPKLTSIAPQSLLKAVSSHPPPHMSDYLRDLVRAKLRRLWEPDVVG